MQSTAPASEEGERTTSFGIELEFILITKFQRQLTRLSGILTKFLSQPIYAECSLRGCQTIHEHAIRVSSDPGHFTHWTTGVDLTVKLSDDELRQVPEFQQFYSSFNAEVRSPAFKIDVRPLDPAAGTLVGHKPWVSPTWEIAQVLRLLNSINEPEKRAGNLRIIVNQSSGLHIHVGSGIPGKGFEMKTIKNILGLATVFERQFDSIHDVTRIGGSTLTTIDPRTHVFASSRDLEGSPKWTSPLSAHHARRTYRSLELEFLDLNVIAPKGTEDTKRFPMRKYAADPVLHEVGSTQNVIAWLQVIQKAESYKDLAELYNGLAPKASTVNILYLEPLRKLQTIEFRQHAGTLDFEEVMAWVGACVRTVEYCKKVSERDYIDLLYSRWNDFSFTFPDLLMSIGVPGRTVRHYERTLQEGKHEYADVQYERAMDLEIRYGRSDPLTSLVGFVESVRRKNRARRAIKNRIELKHISGGYGMYPDGCQPLQM